MWAETTARPKKTSRGVISGKRKIAGVKNNLIFLRYQFTGKVSVSLRLSREKFIIPNVLFRTGTNRYEPVRTGTYCGAPNCIGVVTEGLQ